MIAQYLLAALASTRSSSAEVARALGITKQAVSLIQKGGKMGEETAAKAAALLGLDPCVTLARLRADYATGDARAIWLEVVRRLSPAASDAGGGSGHNIDTVKIIVNAKSKKAPHNAPLMDTRLFPQKPAATLALIVAWCRAVPHIEPDAPRFAYYVRSWDVPYKIQRHTDNGQLPAEVLREHVTPADCLTALTALQSSDFFPQLRIDRRQAA